MYNSETYRLQNKIIQETARELNLPVNVVYKVVRSQWCFLKEIVETQESDKMFFSLKIRHLGMFGVKNFLFKVSKKYNHLHVPVDKIYKDIDPRKQNTNQSV